MCSPVTLAKEVAFSTLQTILALEWEGQLQVAALPQGVPWQVEQMEVMEVITPIRRGKR